jgi:hypothetical protein
MTAPPNTSPKKQIPSNKWIIAIVLCCILVPTLHAAIGKSEKWCDSKYGTKVNKSKIHSLDTVAYSNSKKLKTLAYFWKDSCVGIIYLYKTMTADSEEYLKSINLRNGETLKDFKSLEGGRLLVSPSGMTIM